jgi:hypothetical protein
MDASPPAARVSHVWRHPAHARAGSFLAEEFVFHHFRAQRTAPDASYSDFLTGTCHPIFVRHAKGTELAIVAEYNKSKRSKTCVVTNPASP